MEKPNVALIHDYLIQYGGAEKTLEAITEIYQEAPIYTGLYNPKSIPQSLSKKTIICTKNPLLNLFPKYLSFLMPYVFEGFDLRKYNLVISDGTAWPKGVLTKTDQLHIAYIHTPPRFLYGYSVESTKRNAWYFKPIIPVIDHFLRLWDFSAAQRPDYLVANSVETQNRIKKYYDRESVVIYPPVEVDFEGEGKDTIGKPYFIAIGRLVAYKNFESLIKAFNQTKFTLVIIGTGREEKNLKKIAGKNIIFAGKVSDEKKHHLLQHSLGLINPVVDEDLGIVPIEAMAHGKPVLVHKSGGHLETVTEGMSGMFFESLEPTLLAGKVAEFEKAIEAKEFEARKIKQSVQKFSKERFVKEFREFVTAKWKEFETENA